MNGVLTSLTGYNPISFPSLIIIMLLSMIFAVYVCTLSNGLTPYCAIGYLYWLSLLVIFRGALIQKRVPPPFDPCKDQDIQESDNFESGNNPVRLTIYMLIFLLLSVQSVLQLYICSKW